MNAAMRPAAPDSERTERAARASSAATGGGIFGNPGTQAILRQPATDGTRGAVLMDILYDPPRHERLPINDDEIIDRALAAQGLAGTPVTLLTYDTSQAARGRHAGLAVNKLAKPLGDEPEDTRGKKKARQPAADAQAT